MRWSVIIVFTTLALMVFTVTTVTSSTVFRLHNSGRNQLVKPSHLKTTNSKQQQSAAGIVNVKSFIPSKRHERSIDVIKYGRLRRRRESLNDQFLHNMADQQQRETQLDRLGWYGYNIMYPWM